MGECWVYEEPFGRCIINCPISTIDAKKTTPQVDDYRVFKVLRGIKSIILQQVDFF